MSTNRTQRASGWADLKTLPIGPNGRRLCRRCQTEVPKGRRTFCSEPCVHEWRIRTDPGYVRKQVQARDHGVCANCQLDTRTLLALLRRFMTTHEAHTALRARGFRPYSHFWEADHIVPVSEGGGECGLENYRTLCIPCHKAATKELKQRLAQKETSPA